MKHKYLFKAFDGARFMAAEPDGASEDKALGGGGSAEPDKPVGFDDFLKDPKMQSEFDRRITKALATSREKWEQEKAQEIEEAKTEAEKLAKMNADQKAAYDAQKRDAELAKREAEISKRELTATAKETLAEKRLPLELASVLDYTNADACAASIDAVEAAFKKAVEETVESRLVGNNPPKKADDKKKPDDSLASEILKYMQGH